MMLTTSAPARVLVTDDDDQVRSMIVTLLRQNGLEVCEAREGAEALQVLAGEAIDVVLLDFCMPGMTGLEVLRQALKLDATLSIILISGEVSIGEAVAAVKNGAYDFIPKPFATDALLLKINHAIEIHRLKKENQRLRSAANEPEPTQRAEPAELASCPVKDCPHSSAAWRMDGSTSLREMVRASIARTERAILVRVLSQTGGNKARAARLLQIDYKTLRSKVKGYGLSEADDSGGADDVVRP